MSKITHNITKEDLTGIYDYYDWVNKNAVEWGWKNTEISDTTAREIGALEDELMCKENKLKREVEIFNVEKEKFKEKFETERKKILDERAELIKERNEIEAMRKEIKDMKDAIEEEAFNKSELRELMT